MQHFFSSFLKYILYLLYAFFHFSLFFHTIFFSYPQLRLKNFLGFSLQLHYKYISFLWSCFSFSSYCRAFFSLFSMFFAVMLQVCFICVTIMYSFQIYVSYFFTSISFIILILKMWILWITL